MTCADLGCAWFSLTVVTCCSIKSLSKDAKYAADRAALEGAGRRKRSTDVIPQGQAPAWDACLAALNSVQQLCLAQGCACASLALCIPALCAEAVPCILTSC